MTKKAAREGVENDDFWVYFTEYAAELADKSGYAWGFKGVPRKDKQLEEAEVAQILAQHHGLEAPIQHSEAPDVRVLDDRHIGIELTELVDERMRERHAVRRTAERKQGLSQKNAIDAERAAFRMASEAAQMARAGSRNWEKTFQEMYSANHPTSGHISRYAFANWDVEAVASQLDEIMRKKDRKLQRNAKNYAEIWLGIFTAEMAITRDLIFLAKDKLAYRATAINKAFVVLSYDPAVGNYPVIEI